MILLVAALHVALTATPQVSLGPSRVAFTVRLTGTEEPEKLYCPGQLWEFGDGTRAYRESDCPEYDKREEYPRVFRISHDFAPRWDQYTVKVTLTKDGYAVEQRSVTVIVK